MIAKEGQVLAGTWEVKSADTHSMTLTNVTDVRLTQVLLRAGGDHDHADKAIDVEPGGELVIKSPLKSGNSHENWVRTPGKFVLQWLVPGRQKSGVHVDYPQPAKPYAWA